jgi:hypothetical protein
MPKISITKVLENVSQKLHGYYFGWARIIQKGEKTTIMKGDDTWHQAVVSSLTLDASQLARASIAEANKRYISVRLICDYESNPQDGASIEVQVMGFLRPDEPPKRAVLYKGLQVGDEAAAEAAMLSDVNDVSIVQSILNHPAWSLERIREKRDQQRPHGLGRITTGIANTRMAAQRHMDRVPLRKLGVRMPIDRFRDKAILTRGFYVVR